MDDIRKQKLQANAAKARHAKLLKAQADAQETVTHPQESDEVIMTWVGGENGEAATHSPPPSLPHNGFLNDKNPEFTKPIAENGRWVLCANGWEYLLGR